MPKIYRIKDGQIDFTTVNISNPIKKRRSSFIYPKVVDGNNLNPILVEIPPMLVKTVKSLNRKYVSHEVILQLVGKDELSTDTVVQFYTTLDSLGIQLGKNNKDKWPFEGSPIRYKAVVRSVVDEDYVQNGVVKLRLFKSRNLTTKVYHNKKRVPVSEYENIIKEGCYVKTIVEVVAIWIKGSVFGFHVRPHQIAVVDSNSKEFTEDSGSDLDDIDEIDDIDDIDDIGYISVTSDSISDDTSSVSEGLTES